MNSRTLLKIAIVAVLVAGIAVLWFSPLRAHLGREHVHETVDFVRGLWYGPAALLAAYAIGCIFAIPARLFMRAAPPSRAAAPSPSPPAPSPPPPAWWGDGSSGRCTP